MDLKKCLHLLDLDSEQLDTDGEDTLCVLGQFFFFTLRGTKIQANIDDFVTFCFFAVQRLQLRLFNY